MSDISGFVTRIDTNVVVIPEDSQSSRKLLKIGFSLCPEPGSYIFSPKDDGDKYSLIERLRDEGFAFSGGAGWSPSEVVDYARDQGYVSGKFLRVTWFSQGSRNIEYF
ncbi:hypothetical protein [uncultured Microbulbifer sp.]|uniref:hypothetical protein n=1 Tax=uncultured Microbulbifer sp. TaxID=348147 RepID=UPI0026340259|nr:hypothetical protein [uncultured Microbulbifer sp.]